VTGCKPGETATLMMGGVEETLEVVAVTYPDDA